MDGQKIIDFHCHIFPEKIASKATGFVGEYYGLDMHGGGIAETLIDRAKKLNMQGFLIHSSATKPAQVENVNDFIAEYARKEKLYIGFGTIHKDFENIEEELARVKSLGLKGIKLHPDFQNFKIDQPEMDRIYQCASDLELPILMHVGDKKTDNSKPHRLANVLNNFPKLTVIAAHMGGYSEWDAAMECLYGKDVYFDTSSTMLFVKYEKVREMIYMHGVDRILFGSDFPIQWTSEALEDIYRLKLPDEDRNKILYENAARLLKL